jgi:hypothetical protein
MMFGITTPDAIALGMLLIAAVAMLKGSNSGAAAKEKAVRDATMVGIAGGIVQADQFSDYVKVLDKLSIAMTGHAAALDRQHEVKHTNALEELAEKIDDLRNSRGEHPHRRK